MPVCRKIRSIETDGLTEIGLFRLFLTGFRHGNLDEQDAVAEDTCNSLITLQYVSTGRKQFTRCR